LSRRFPNNQCGAHCSDQKSLRNLGLHTLDVLLRVPVFDARSLIVLIGPHQSELIALPICVVLSVCWEARRWLVVDSLTSPTRPCSESSIWCGLSQRSSPTTSCASQHQFTTITRLVRRLFLYSVGWPVLYDAGCGAQPVVGRQHRMPAQPTH
jgi:hypothetical protein